MKKILLLRFYLCSHYAQQLIVAQFYLDAQITSSINLDTPTHNGNVIEIKDDIGVVFKLTE